MGFLKLLLIFAVIGYCKAAPKPVQWDELGRKIQNFGERALPAIRTACGVLGSSQTGYPQIQGYYPPIQSYYPQYQGREFPQAPNFPISPKQNYYSQFGNFPPQQFGKSFSPQQFGKSFPPQQFGNNFPPQIFGNNFPPNKLPPTTLEQDDLNKGLEKPKLPRIPPYIPPSEENSFDSESEEDYSDNTITDKN